MDISELYIKMCDCPEIQEKSNDDRCSFWAKTLMTDKYWVWMDLHNPSDIYLPRQDQIQEIAFPSLVDNPLLLMSYFKKFVKYLDELYEDRIEFEPESMEQLWLAFYMHEEHQKIWDKDKWVKKEE